MKTKIFSLCMIAALMASCAKEEEKQKPVDLRFKVEDKYELAAQNPEQIQFVVKSSDPWNVDSYNPEWCEITPSQGEAGEKYTVGVQYANNDELDDRIDTLVIKSGYWTGKWVTVLQKGIAYMTVTDCTEELSETGASAKLDVKSNQKWSAAVSEGTSWITITSGATGEFDGSVLFSVSENKGEARTGYISVYDRHNVEMYKILIRQKGLILTPAVSEIRVYADVVRYELEVESNAEWYVEKDNKDQEWYNFAQTQYSGNATMVIELGRNESTSMIRNASFTISTVKQEGVEPIIRTIELKQAYSPVPVMHKFDQNEFNLWSLNRGSVTVTDGGFLFSGDSRLIAEDLEMGEYRFHISSMTPTSYACMYYIASDWETELRWHLDAANKTTDFSTRPSVGSLPQVPIEPGEHTVTMSFTEAGDGYTCLKWILDGETLYTQNTTDCDQLKSFIWGDSFIIIFGSGQGEVLYDYYEFVPAVVWN